MSLGYICVVCQGREPPGWDTARHRQSVHAVSPHLPRPFLPPPPSAPAVLENRHVACLYALTGAKPAIDVFARLDASQWRDVRFWGWPVPELSWFSQKVLQPPAASLRHSPPCLVAPASCRRSAR